MLSIILKKLRSLSLMKPHTPCMIYLATSLRWSFLATSFVRAPTVVYCKSSFANISYTNKQKLGVIAPPVRIDSQAKYGALSRGDGAIYLRFPHKGYREKIWDHAAGCIVVTGKQTF